MYFGGCILPNSTTLLYFQLQQFLSGICYCLCAKLILEGTDGYAASGVYADTGGIGGSGSYGGMDCIENFRISICPLS